MNIQQLRAGPGTGRRGIAMLLVLICLSTATIVTVSYLSSRDNSAQIGLNISDSSMARWAAMSGVDMGIAIMETNTDWRNNHDAGKLIDGYTVGSATLFVTVSDMVTGDPPDDESSHFKITSTAQSGGVTQTATATAMAMPRRTENTVAVDLSEFTVFAASKLLMQDATTVGRWATSPAGRLGRPLAMASRSGSIGTLDLRHDAAVLDTTLFLGPGASGSVILNSKSPDLQVVELSDPVPAPAPPTAPMILGGIDYDLLAGMDMLVMDTDLGNATVRMGGDLTLMGPMVLTVNGDLNIESSSIVRISGDVKIAVFDDVSIAESAIELEPGASLTMFVGDDIMLDGSYIGDDRMGLNTLDNTGYASYMDPRRIAIYGSQDPGGVIGLEGTSIMKGSIYNPYGFFYANDASALYGRVAADYVEMRNNAAVFYDHSLNQFTGFTNERSLVYEDDGTIRDEILALASLDDSALQSLADSLDVVVTRTLTTLVGDGALLGALDTPEPATSTPRTQPVRAEITSVGTDLSAIENQ